MNLTIHYSPVEYFFQTGQNAGGKNFTPDYLSDNNFARWALPGKVIAKKEENHRK